MQLKNQHAIISGGSKGIGFAIARALLAAGANVSLLARDQNGLRSAKECLLSDFPQANIHLECGDVTDFNITTKAFDACVEQMGTCHILVNNAGNAQSLPFQKLDEKSWRQAFEINLHPAFSLTHKALPQMIEQKSGRIINIASTAGLKGFIYVSAYCAAKHALVGLTRSLALEVAEHGITVNCICPGFTETDMLKESIAKVVKKTGKTEQEVREHFLSAGDQKKFIRPEEVAEKVLWICAPEQKSLTGQALIIDETRTG